MPFLISSLPEKTTMTDSPAIHAFLDPKEQSILDSLLHLRDKLSLLKQDKSTYIKSHDVLGLYEEVVEQVHLLNNVRKEDDKPLEQNRGVLDWCYGSVGSIVTWYNNWLTVNSGLCPGRLFSAYIAVFFNNRTKQRSSRSVSKKSVTS